MPKNQNVRKEIADDFANNTSAHGLNSIRRNQNLFIKLGWLICVLAAWSIAVYQVWKALEEYFEYPITVNVRVKYLDQGIFPAVTLCNLNPLRRKSMEKHPQMKELFHLLSTDPSFLNHTQLNENTLRYLVSFNMYEHQLNITEFGHEIEDMLMGCEFQDVPCGPDNFTTWPHPIYGLCYTFFVAQDKYPTMMGPDYGLSLTLHTENHAYLPRVSSGAGFKVNHSL